MSKAHLYGRVEGNCECEEERSRTCVVGSGRAITAAVD